MRLPAAVAAMIFAIPTMVAAQTPRFTPTYLGDFLAGRINESDEMISRVTIAGASRAIVARPGQAYDVLPLPEGMQSSWANDINDQGVVVGQVGPFSSPEFTPQAVVWTPLGGGNYSVTPLGALPGHTVSVASAINGLGDIVGYSESGGFRTAVQFRGPGDVVDLSPYGIFDPVDINDQRVLVDHSFTAKRLDLDTMIAEDLGVPNPLGGPSYLATQAAAINESNQVAGAAILAAGGNSDRQVAWYTDGVGWQILNPTGAGNSASDINAAGDMVVRIIITPYLRTAAGALYTLEELIVNDVGHWFPTSTTAGWLNDSGHIVLWATNPTTGQSGALLLTPEASTGSPVADLTSAGLDLAVAPNPFRTGTTIRFTNSTRDVIGVSIYDAAGRRIRDLDAPPVGDGPRELVWNGRDTQGQSVASGVYFVRVEASNGSAIRRVTLVH
ncbi:MAG: FlgD immunoglobulin-like domain containing protein [bacterium]